MYTAQHRHAVTPTFIPTSVLGIIVGSALMHSGTLDFSVCGLWCGIFVFDFVALFHVHLSGTCGSGGSGLDIVSGQIHCSTHMSHSKQTHASNCGRLAAPVTAPAAPESD